MAARLRTHFTTCITTLLTTYLLCRIESLRWIKSKITWAMKNPTALVAVGFGG